MERSLGVSITIIDNEGVLHTPEGYSVFGHERQSHRKNRVCDIAFSRACIDHCRYAMNEKCVSHTESFLEVCWKGVAEIVTPLTLGGVHYGVLYAGSWRVNEVPPQTLPKPFAAAYRVLPLWKNEHEAMMPLITVFAHGVVGKLKEMNAFASPDSRANRIASYIHDNASRTIRLSDIAVLLGLSPSRTSALLRTLFGATLPSLVTAERIKRVQSLLTSSDMTLEAIAPATGFFDEFHLSRSFTKQVGISPRAYRERHVRSRRSMRDAMDTQ